MIAKVDMDELPILLPMSRAAFLSEYFEKQFLYVRSSVDCHDYCWNRFGQDFHGIEPAMGTVRLYRDGQVDRQGYQVAEQREQAVVHEFNPQAIHEALTEGGTLVVNRFEKCSTWVASLCRQLSDLTANTTVGNAYATKGGTGTFGKHWDTHCVFATQLIGAKRWKVYKPTLELPLAFQTSKAEKAHFNGEAVFDDVLRAGDVLYIPRGWWHEVTPIPDQPSLHIAVGVHSMKTHDYVKWVLNRKMGHDLSFRRSLDRSSPDDALLEEACGALLRECRSQTSFQQYLRECQVAVAQKQVIDFDAMFQQAVQPAQHVQPLQKETHDENS
jgi:50S ribosomal protein L16 3-hydroxylase